MLMTILAWILFGALAGWIASMIMGTNAQMGAMANILTGIAGAILGGFLFGMLGLTDASRFDFGSLIVAIIGAVALIWAMKRLQVGAMSH